MLVLPGFVETSTLCFVNAISSHLARERTTWARPHIDHEMQNSALSRFTEHQPLFVHSSCARLEGGETGAQSSVRSL